MILLKSLNSLSLIYSALMLTMALVLLKLNWSGHWNSDIVFPLVIILHALAQLIYSMKTRPMLSMSRYEEYETLDGRLMFESNGEVVGQPAFIVVLACIASFFELVTAYIGVRGISSLFSFQFKENEDILHFLFYLTGILLSVPAIIFNLRTWNIKCIVASGNE